MTKRMRLVILSLLLIGIFFLFFNLDKKFYWYDEAFTSLRISGYTEREVIKKLGNGQILKAEDLQYFQKPTPEKTVSNTIQGLALEEPQLTPLYFILVRYWAQLFGDSVIIIRSFSAVISLLIAPCIYWLCYELFESPLTGWIAAPLIAVSPWQILYGQEARPYSLWSVTILVSSALLLRSLRLKKTQWWFAYALSIIVSFYTHFLTILVVFSHALYLFIVKGINSKQNLRHYCLCLLASFLCFTPWLATILSNHQTISQRTTWANYPSNFATLLGNWVINIVRGYFDFGLTSDSPKNQLIIMGVTCLLLIILVGYSFYFLIKQTPVKVWSFVVILGAVSVLMIMIPDVIWGGIRSTKSRYLYPFYLSIRLSIAYLLATKIYLLKAPFWRNQWKIIFLTLALSGIISCGISSQAQSWWNKEWGELHPQIAQIINQYQKPLIVINIAESSYANAVSLSYLLDQKVRYQLLVDKPIPLLHPEFSDVFIYTATKISQAEIEKRVNTEVLPMVSEKNHKVWLWKIKQSA